MSDGFFDRNLSRLLRLARRKPVAQPHFRESLLRKLQDEAAEVRQAAASEARAAELGRAGVSRFRWDVAAAVMLIVVAGGLGIRTALKDRMITRSEVPPWKDGVSRTRPEPSLVLPADRAVVASVHPGSVGSVSLVRRDVEVARLELQNAAEVELRPGAVPVLALRHGVLRVEAREALVVKAAHVALDVSAGADLEIEFSRGDRFMNKTWLVPGGIGAAAGAALVAIVLHKGSADVKTPESRPAPAAIERPIVVEVPTTRPVADDDAARRFAQAERKIADLEKKLAAAKKESDKLAADLVQKKGVTIDSITARLAELRKGSGMNVLLPGSTADLIADLKGLGEAGTQALLDLLKSEDPKDRFIAAKLLEDLKDPAAIPALRDVALNDPDPTASNMAGHALALMGDPRTVDTLREMVSKNRSWESQVNALWGLVNLGDAQGIEQATAYMMEEKNSKQARAALGANIAVFMHSPEVMPIVDATVRDFSKSAQVMEIAIDYYKAVGSPEARQRLQAIADNTTLSQEIRDAARQALL